MAIVAGAVVLRLALLPTTAHLTEIFTDEFTFKRHVVFIHEKGLLDSFRETNTAYIAYQYILWLLAAVYGWLGGAFDTDAASLRVLIKIPPLLFDVALIVATYAAGRTLRPDDRGRSALTVAAVIAFHPAVVYDSAVWAQIDSAVALAALGAVIFAASGRPELALAALAAGLLLKPQPIIYAPVVGVLLLRRGDARGIATGGLAGLAIIVLPLLPWLIAGDLERLVDVYRDLFGGTDIPAITQNAYNLWWFVPFEHVPETHDVAFSLGAVEATYQRLSLGLSMVAAVVAALYAWRRPDVRGGLIAAAYLALAFYVLPTSTHERYMYPLVALLAPVLLIETRFRYVYAIVSATLFLNMFLVAPPVESWSRRWDDDLFTHYVAGINVAVFLAYSWMMLRELTETTDAHRWTQALLRRTRAGPAAVPTDDQGPS